MCRLIMRAPLLLALAWIAVLPASANPPSYDPRGPGDVYLALGDALALGMEHPDNADHRPGYPDLLLESPSPLSYQVVLHKEHSRRGETSGSMVQDRPDVNVSSQLTRAVELIKNQRDAGRSVGLVTLSIGFNDVLGILRNPAQDRVRAQADFQ